MCNSSLVWGVQRCHTYKIGVSKYSKITAEILHKKVKKWGVVCVRGCEPRIAVIMKMQEKIEGGLVGDENQDLKLL